MTEESRAVRCLRHEFYWWESRQWFQVYQCVWCKKKRWRVGQFKPLLPPTPEQKP